MASKCSRGDDEGGAGAIVSVATEADGGFVFSGSLDFDGRGDGGNDGGARGFDGVF